MRKNQSQLKSHFLHLWVLHSLSVKWGQWCQLSQNCWDSVVDTSWIDGKGLTNFHYYQLSIISRDSKCQTSITCSDLWPFELLSAVFLHWENFSSPLASSSFFSCYQHCDPMSMLQDFTMGGLGVTFFHLEVACILCPAVINYTKGGEGRVWLTALNRVVICAL